MKLKVFNLVVLGLGYFNVISYEWSLILCWSAIFTAIFNEMSTQDRVIEENKWKEEG